MRSLIERHGKYDIAGEADSSPAAVAMIAKAAPDFAIIDIGLKSSNGIELTKAVRAQSAETLVLVASMHPERLYAERALRAGARGYLMKDEAIEKLMLAIESIEAGEIYLSEHLKSRMLMRLVGQPAEAALPSVELLSDREIEVLELIGNGYGTSDIAKLLHLSTKTVDSYREHLKLKLRLQTSGELTRYAIHWRRSELG